MINIAEALASKQPKIWAAPISNCQICHSSLSFFKYFIDGRTNQGVWAIMCPRCHSMVGRGLGVGRGQKYSTETREKVAG